MSYYVMRRKVLIALQIKAIKAYTKVSLQSIAKARGSFGTGRRAVGISENSQRVYGYSKKGAGNQGTGVARRKQTASAFGIFGTGYDGCCVSQLRSNAFLVLKKGVGVLSFSKTHSRSIGYGEPSITTGKKAVAFNNSVSNVISAPQNVGGKTARMKVAHTTNTIAFPVDVTGKTAFMPLSQRTNAFALIKILSLEQNYGVAKGQTRAFAVGIIKTPYFASVTAKMRSHAISAAFRSSLENSYASACEKNQTNGTAGLLVEASFNDYQNISFDYFENKTFERASLVEKQ